MLLPCAQLSLIGACSNGQAALHQCHCAAMPLRLTVTLYASVRHQCHCAWWSHFTALVPRRPMVTLHYTSATSPDGHTALHQYHCAWWSHCTAPAPQRTMVTLHRTSATAPDGHAALHQCHCARWSRCTAPVPLRLMVTLPCTSATALDGHATLHQCHCARWSHCTAWPAIGKNIYCRSIICFVNQIIIAVFSCSQDVRLNIYVWDLSKVYIPTRVIGTCFCGKSLGGG